MTIEVTASAPAEPRSDQAWGAVPQLSEQAVAQIAGALEASQSAGTRRVYASDWRRFRSWCHTHGHSALPAHPATVAAYLVDAADTLTGAGEKAYSSSTLNRWVSVIGHYHRTANLRNPCTETLVTATLSGIRRTYATNGDRPRNPRSPLLVEDIVTIVRSARHAVTGWATEVHERRDSALLLMGFAGPSGAATSSPCTVGTSPCTGSMECVCGCGGRRRTGKAQAWCGRCRSPPAITVARRARMCGGRRSSPRSIWPGDPG